MVKFQPKKTPFESHLILTVVKWKLGLEMDNPLHLTSLKTLLISQCIGETNILGP